MAKERSIVGDLINFRGLVYSPVNEQGVVYLFSKVAEDLNMYDEEVRTAFPDCVARRFNGRGWEKVYIEFEFTSSNFLQHGHDPGECDIVVCWENDWSDCPLEVLELREVIKQLPNRPVQRPAPEPGEREAGRQESERLFERVAIPQAVRLLYYSLETQVLNVDNAIWRKVAPRDFSFYSPKRVFAYARPQKRSLRVTLFTRGEPLAGVSPVGYETGGYKWGRIHVRSQEDVEEAVNAMAEAWRRLCTAVDRNEPTGWYAEVEDAAEEESDTGAEPASDDDAFAQTDEASASIDA